MEPNNIEKQIREKLNSREIQPSAQAWDRLDAMLSVAEEKKTKRSYGWLYIAAAILVFASVGLFFYNQENTIPVNETVVGIENNKDTIQENATEIAAKENAVSTDNSSQQNEQMQQSASSDKRSNNQSNQSIINKSAVAQNQKSTTRGEANQKTNSSSIINKEKAIEFQTSSDVAVKDIPKVMTENKAIVVEKATSTNKDAVAATEVKKSEANSKVKVNANSLLSEVDGELDLTFREKVFKKVNKNYKE